MIGGIFGKKRNPFEVDEAIVVEQPGQDFGDFGAGVGPQGGDPMGAPEVKKPGFFQSDRGRNAIGTFADTLIQLRSGVNPGISQGLQQGQMLRARAESAQAQRAADNQDWLARQEYKAENPAPTATMRDVEWLNSLSDADREKALEAMRAKNPTFFKGWDGQRYQSGVPAAPTAGPQVGTIEDGYRFGGGDPANPASWEKLGGASGDTSGGF
jgi:hypothetical protein